MQRTFNMGIGYVILVSLRLAAKAVSMLAQSGYEAFIIGEIAKGKKGVLYR